MISYFRSSVYLQNFILVIATLLLFYSQKGAILNSYITFNGDSAFYLSSGKFLSKGIIPYSDFWDHKTPFIHYLSLLCYESFDRSYFGGVFISTVAVLIAFILWSILIFNRNIILGLIFTIAYFILLKTNHEWVFMGETFCFLVSSLAIYFLFKNKSPTYGNTFIGFFLLVFSFLIKQLVVFDSIIVLIFLVLNYEFWQSRIKQFVLLIITSSSTAILINLIPLIVTDSLNEFIPCFLHNFGYSSNRLGFNLKSFDFAYSLPLFGSLLLIFTAFGVRGRQAKRTLTLLLLFAWVIGSWFMTNGTHHHYMITLWQPFLFSFFYLSRVLPSPLSIKLKPYTLLICIPIFIFSPLLASKFEEMKLKPDIYTFIEENTNKDDTYFMFSNHNGGTLMHLDRMPSSRYYYLAPNAHKGGDKHLSSIIESIESNPPDILIISELDSAIKVSKNFQILHHFLSDLAAINYSPLKYEDATLPLTNISLSLFLKKESS